MTVARFGLRAVDIRSRLLDFDRIVQMQVDPYLFFREAYLQNRQRAIMDGVRTDSPGKSEGLEQQLLED